MDSFHTACIFQLFVKTKDDVNACLEDGSIGVYLASGCGHSVVISIFFSLMLMLT